MGLIEPPTIKPLRSLKEYFKCFPRYHFVLSVNCDHWKCTNSNGLPSAYLFIVQNSYQKIFKSKKLYARNYFYLLSNPERNKLLGKIKAPKFHFLPFSVYLKILSWIKRIHKYFEIESCTLIFWRISRRMQIFRLFELNAHPHPNDYFHFDAFVQDLPEYWFLILRKISTRLKKTLDLL